MEEREGSRETREESGGESERITRRGGQEGTHFN